MEENKDTVNILVDEIFRNVAEYLAEYPEEFEKYTKDKNDKN